MQLIGQISNIDIIDKWKEVPAFIIVQGNKNTGKTYLVQYICDKFGLNYIQVNNGIADVRSLIEKMIPNSNTLYHFKDFDRASLQAKNALLKITEEPVIGNHIVITGGNQLQTLESRARKITIDKYSMQEVDTYMTQYIVKADLRKNLYLAGIDTPAKVELYKDYDKLEDLVNYVIDVYKQITYISIDSMICMLQNFDIKPKDDEPDTCLLFLNMLINIINASIKENYKYSYYGILEILIAKRKKLELDKDINRRFLLFQTFFEIINRSEYNVQT